jgi:putative transposase
VGQVPDLPSKRKRTIYALAHFVQVNFYRRRLPHWHPDGKPIFLTWRLHGSLPANVDNVTSSAGEQFVALDRQLDRATRGPLWLKRPDIAQCVADTFFLAANKWKLHNLIAWVIMANHVHMVLDPHKPLAGITRAIKNTSARRANSLLGRTGLPFWQSESYDHWVRDAHELRKIIHYIEWNPVKAGLVASVDQWPWSSASAKLGQARGMPHS